ncbi:MAG: hypothetical protein WAT39_14505 [Planctomycetota bacterium]
MARFRSRSRYGRSSSFSSWREYVPQATRRANAASHALRAGKDGAALAPVHVEGRAITKSFWGKAWCENLEGYSDFSNRLPRGRTYVRNGSVIDLKIGAGAIDALVSGSQVYTVRVTIARLAAARWKELVRQCSGQITSLLDLLQGRFARGVMEVLARRDDGLFPRPRDLAFDCSCPDWAAMCKHVAAVLYGVGARFEQDPSLFFLLRQVNSEDLIAAAAGADGLVTAPPAAASALAGEDLGSVFGIDLDDGGGPVAERVSPSPRAAPAKRRPPRTRTARRNMVREAVDDEGFGEVFGPGLEVTPELLVGFGVPRTTFGNWLTTGVLARTGKRGVYRTTAATLDRFLRVWARARSSA